MSRLSQLADNPAGTSHDQTLGFGYNSASQIVSTTRSNDLFAWAGNSVGTTSSIANGLNQITVHGGSSTSHDARGNMTADGLGKTFGYSSENLLTSASGGVTLSYDPALRLYQVSGATTTRFAYDGADLIAEYNASNALQRRYVHGPGTDEPLVWYEGSGTADRRFLHADERGSIAAVSNSSGAGPTSTPMTSMGDLPSGTPADSSTPGRSGSATSASPAGRCSARGQPDGPSCKAAAQRCTSTPRGPGDRFELRTTRALRQRLNIPMPRCRGEEQFGAPAD